MQQDRFTSHLTDAPHVMLRLTELISDRMRSSDQRRLEFAALGVRERLAILLLDLARTHGERIPEGVRLTAGLSQSELAGSVGSSRERVARLLTELRRRGIVDTSRRGLVIIAPEQLRRIGRGGRLVPARTSARQAAARCSVHSVTEHLCRCPSRRPLPMGHGSAVRTRRREATMREPVHHTILLFDIERFGLRDDVEQDVLRRKLMTSSRTPSSTPGWSRPSSTARTVATV